MKYLQLFEKYKVEIYQNHLNKILKRLGINLYFIDNYSIAINSLFPIVENLLKQSKIKFDKDDVILITIGSLSMTLKERDKEVVKLKHHLDDKDLTLTAKKVAILIDAIHKVYQEFLNKNVSLIDMFSNTKLFIAFLKSLDEITVIYQLKIDNISGYLSGDNVGLATNHGKNLVSELFTRVKLKQKLL